MASERRELLRSALGLAPHETPFPWQANLLDGFLQGNIPPALDIPTGLGKTGVMAVWLVARAYDAKLPRRLIYIVDRRAVVDQATEEALRLRLVVDEDRDVNRRPGLPENQSLRVATLRGEQGPSSRWRSFEAHLWPRGPACSGNNRFPEAAISTCSNAVPHEAGVCKCRRLSRAMIATPVCSRRRCVPPARLGISRRKQAHGQCPASRAAKR